MMLLAPPPRGVLYQVQRTQLTGIDYEIRWAYNSRLASWAISIAVIGIPGEANEAEPVPVLSGAKLHIGYDLLRRCNEPNRPAGTLWVYSVDGGKQHPGLHDLGSRCHVLYLEPGELSS